MFFSQFRSVKSGLFSAWILMKHKRVCKYYILMYRYIFKQNQFVSHAHCLLRCFYWHNNKAVKIVINCTNRVVRLKFDRCFTDDVEEAEEMPLFDEIFVCIGISRGLPIVSSAAAAVTCWDLSPSRLTGSNLSSFIRNMSLMGGWLHFGLDITASDDDLWLFCWSR